MLLACVVLVASITSKQDRDIVSWPPQQLLQTRGLRLYFQSETTSDPSATGHSTSGVIWWLLERRELDQ